MIQMGMWQGFVPETAICAAKIAYASLTHFVKYYLLEEGSFDEPPSSLISSSCTCPKRTPHAIKFV
jgi:hypothetical protein